MNAHVDQRPITYEVLGSEDLRTWSVLGRSRADYAWTWFDALRYLPTVPYVSVREAANGGGA